MNEGAILGPGLGRRQTAAGLAFNRLRKAIINGELLPDAKLTETELAKSLHISRTPLRNALQRLEVEGWIRRTSTGGIRVGGVSDSEIEALYDVRLPLESLALKTAIVKMDASGMASLRANIAEQKRALQEGHYSLAADLSEAFHHIIWQIGSNDVCIEFLESVNDRTKRYRRIAFDGQANMRQGVAEHEELLERIGNGDTPGAIELLAHHIETSRDAVKAAFLDWERATG